jgi:cytochrome c oxidase subunit 2
VTLPKIAEGSFWLPRESSTLAPEVDRAWDIVMALCVVMFVGVVVSVVYFTWKYRRNGGAGGVQVAHNPKLELLWTIIPTILVIGLFFVGLTGFVNASVAPANAYEVQVTAEKWLWTFTYPNGTVSPSKLVVPKGRPVKLVMSAKDVLHSFYIPEFRIKRDVIPGTYTTIWFEAPEERETVLECAEYCGKGHSEMLATVSVVSDEKFDEFLNGGDDAKTPPAELGKKLFSQWGCATCHSLDGTKGQGPSLKDVYGSDVTLSTGSSVKADDAYIRESIVQSQAKLVQGFPPIMPVFQGVLKDKQVDALVAFVKSQSAAGAAAGGAQPAKKP